MSDAVQFFYAGESIPSQSSKTVLDALISADKSVSYSCREGVCQSCLMTFDPEGVQPSTSAQKGLSDAQVKMNYVLACQCQSIDGLHLLPLDKEGITVDAEVVEIAQHSDSIFGLTVKADLGFTAGQYFNLWLGDQVRSYSAANLPGPDGEIEFHIKKIDGGELSPKLANLKAGEHLRLQGPMGKCVYAAESDSPLLLASIGTGLAPIVGVLRDALAHDHQGDIHLVVGARHQSDFYYQESIEQLAAEHEHISLHWLALDHPEDTKQDIYAYTKTTFGALNGYKVYVCGAATFVQKYRKQCFLSGANMGDIVADIFLAGGQAK